MIYHLFSNLRKTRALIFPSPQTIALIAAQESALLAIQMLLQLREASDNTQARAALLRQELLALRSEFKRVRVVAHSLGARLLVQALSEMPNNLRPFEVHLCAPALSENDAISRHLDGLCAGTTYLYYCQRDFILNTVYQLLHDTDIIGANGVKNFYARLVTIDCDSFFDTLVHNQYRNEFHRIVPSQNKQGNK